MPTNEPYVPNNLPYGERGRTREAMQQAGVPLGPTNGAAGRGAAGEGVPAPPNPGGPASGLDLLAQSTPGDFQFLTDPESMGAADQPAAEPDSPIQALARSAQSSFGAAVLSRLADRR